MPGGMPYQLEKGPYLSVTESVLNVGQNERLDLWRLMVARTPPESLPSLDSTTLNPGPQNTKDKRVDHMYKEWFGKRYLGPGRWNDQLPFDAGNPRPTGYWHNWYGDAEGIVAETFLRAVEVSLGLDHPASANPMTATPTRCWPIEVVWRCPAPWLEGWVTWRREGGNGHVMVHLHTPSHNGSALLLTPIRTAPHNGAPDYVFDPDTCNSARGMWVIAHERQVRHPLNYNTTVASTPGQWALPTFGAFVESRGPIVTVQPNERDGGVLAGGRGYAPSP